MLPAFDTIDNNYLCAKLNKNIISQFLTFLKKSLGKYYHKIKNKQK